MTDRPIIFSASMIRALLDGRKTMTRRLAWQLRKGTPREGSRITTEPHPDHPGGFVRRMVKHEQLSPWQEVRPGDRLWVRESYRPNDIDPSRAVYRSDCKAGAIGPWRPSIHMPRWASRITLAVTAIKIERLQDITPADAIAEGIAPAANSQTIDCDTPNPVHEFRDLWNSLHGDGAWQANPEVVALTFAAHQVNIDRMDGSPLPSTDGKAVAAR